MKNFLEPVVQNEMVKKVTREIGKFYISHESAILTGGTIGFSLATTAVAMKNASKINDILEDGKEVLETCNSKKERNQVYKLILQELTPLVTPIIIFQSATIGLALYSKKQSDRKIAEMAGALSIAQQAISKYQEWQKETEKALGEKEYAKLQKNIYKNQEVDGRRFIAIASEGAPGEILIVDKYSGRPFWCTTDRIINAVNEMMRRLDPSGGYDQQTINDLYELIGNHDLTPTALGEYFGYAPGEGGFNNVSAYFSDTHYVFPNGTKIPAFELYLWPEPVFIGDWD